jgi:hypothetical protein
LDARVIIAGQPRLLRKASEDVLLVRQLNRKKSLGVTKLGSAVFDASISRVDVGEFPRLLVL